jgi:hypothetical protein
VNSTVPVRQEELARSLSIVMLPKDRPAIGNQALVRDFRWSDATEVVPEVAALATPVTVQWIPSEREFNPQQNFKFVANSGRYVLVTIRHGIAGFGDYRLSKDHAVVVAVPNLPRSSRSPRRDHC